jgi:hypothetical protein
MSTLEACFNAAFPFGYCQHDHRRNQANLRRPSRVSSSVMIAGKFAKTYFATRNASAS